MTSFDLERFDNEDITVTEWLEQENVTLGQFTNRYDEEKAYDTLMKGSIWNYEDEEILTDRETIFEINSSEKNSFDPSALYYGISGSLTMGALYCAYNAWQNPEIKNIAFSGLCAFLCGYGAVKARNMGKKVIEEREQTDEPSMSRNKIEERENFSLKLAGLQEIENMLEEAQDSEHLESFGYQNN